MLSARRIPVSILVAVAFVLILAPLAWSADTVTVLLKGGERYENVTYRVRPDFNVLEIKSDSGATNLSFSDIQAIYDSDGNDIAPRLLGKGYRPLAAAPDSVADEEPGDELSADLEPTAEEAAVAPVRRRRAPSGAPGPLWNIALSLEGRMDQPFGDYYEGAKGGPGYGGTIHVRLSRDLALRGSITRTGVDFGDGFGLVSYDPTVQIISQNYDLNTRRVLFGLEYYKALGGSSPRWGFWFVHASLGSTHHDMKGEAVIFDAMANQTYRAAAHVSDDRFTMQDGIGLIHAISDRVGILGSAELDFLWTKVNSWGGGSTSAIKGFVLGGTVGIAVRL